MIVTTLTYGWGCCGGRGTPLSNLAEYSLFLPALTFVSVEPDLGSVAPGQSVTLTVTFDSTDLDPGPHIAQIVINSNDPDENPTLVTGSLTVLPPDIGVSPASFTVTRDRDEVTTADLTITNTGDGTLVFDIETPFPPGGGPFMSVDPDIGYLAPGQSVTVTVTVTFDSAELDPGVHTGDIVINSNDPDENPTLVTGSLTVLPPEIEVTPQAIDLGILDRDACSTADLTISNTGDGTLVFEITGRGSGDLTAVPTTGDVSPGGNVVIALAVCATDLDPGAYQAEVLISSNDQNEAQVAVVISFTVPPPDIGVSPASFTVTQDRDRVTTADLTITNTGDGTLVFDIETLFLPVGVPWLSVAPDNGTAAPGQSLDLIVTFDTAGLAPGVHTADMVITNNDPDEDPTIIALTLTVPPPDIQVSPSSVAVVFGVDQVTTTNLTVRNLGEGTLVFDLAVQSVEEAPASATANRPHRAGGPDLFGYSWIDSDEPGGPAFDWIDISASGFQIGEGDDRQFTIPIGFDFEFYGTGYDTAYVGTNGILGFSSSGMSSLSNQLLPEPSAPNNLVSAFWDDLRVQSPDRLLREVVGQAPNRKLVVEWFGVTEFGNSGASHTFEVILEERTGNILVQYLSMNGDLDSATVGIENATGDDGLTANFNALYVDHELAVLFSTFQPFTSVEPVGGVVLPGGSLNVTLTLDSTGLERGRHRENVVISSNDPDENPTVVPVTLGVGLAQIEGRVTLEGQTDHSGTIIAFVGPDVQTAVTDENGNFSVMLAPGTYTVRAAHPYHLSAQTVVDVQLGEVLSLTTELLGGDVNNDGVINARDLALAGKNINKNESPWR